MTAKIVMASALRATDVRQRARNRNSTAEISVPECAMPTQNTKLVMYTPQPTGCAKPVTPNPAEIWYAQQKTPNASTATSQPSSTYQRRVGEPSSVPSRSRLTCA